MVTSSNFNVAPKRYHAHIVGWGMCAPETILSNKDLEAILETSDEWIQARTGIKERRIVGEKESTSTLAIRAAQRALEVTDILPADIDLIIVATSTPENIFPSTASIVQHKLGANAAGAFDLSAACSGFVYGMDMATQAIRSGSINTAIVIGAETMTRVMNWRDRSTCILFGDGAGAVVLQRQDRVGGVLSTVMRSDGSGADLLAIPTLGNLEIRDQGGLGEHELHKMYMSGSEVFKFAARIIKPSIMEALNKAHVKLEDVKLIIPHQANERIIQAAARSLDVERERFITNLDRYGNTSAASIPIALNEALEKRLINQGDHIVFIGFGGGLSWGTVVMRWSIPQPGARPINRYYQQRRRASYAIVRLRTWWRKLRRAVSELIAPTDYDEDDFTNG
jgi:3-oxoacyl-[acyl-carrier-protein] synthase III